MIIAKLFGGLGNQMFQYAAARAVAHRIKLPLKLDITSFERYINRLEIEFSLSYILSSGIIII